MWASCLMVACPLLEPGQQPVPDISVSLSCTSTSHATATSMQTMHLSFSSQTTISGLFASSCVLTSSTEPYDPVPSIRLVTSNMLVHGFAVMF